MPVTCVRFGTRTELKKAWFVGILAQSYYIGLLYRATVGTILVIPAQLLVFLPHPSFSWHICMHLWPFQTGLGYIGYPNRSIMAKTSEKHAFQHFGRGRSRAGPGHNQKNAFLTHFPPFFGFWFSSGSRLRLFGTLGLCKRPK